MSTDNKLYTTIKKHFMLPLVVILLYIVYLYVTHNYDYNAILSEILRDVVIAILIAGASTFFFDVISKTELVGEYKKELEKIEKELIIDKDITNLNIIKIYKDRKDANFINDVKNDLNSVHKGTIKIVGISLSNFFGLNHTFNLSNIIENDNIQIKVLLANPSDKEAIGYRTIFEERILNTKSDGIKINNEKAEQVTLNEAVIHEMMEQSIVKSNVKNYIETSIKNIDTSYNEYINNNLFVEMYSVPPMCFLLITDDVIYIENYTFTGLGGSGFIIKANKSSPLYNTYNTHFEKLWVFTGANKKNSGAEHNTNNNLAQTPGIKADEKA